MKQNRTVETRLMNVDSHVPKTMRILITRSHLDIEAYIFQFIYFSDMLLSKHSLSSRLQKKRYQAHTKRREVFCFS